MTYIVTYEVATDDWSLASNVISQLSIYIIICKAAIDDWSLTNCGIY
jgi:hypothetical protein